MTIHPTAVVNPGAKIADDVEIGPYAVIEDNVSIAPGVKIWANAYICNFTEIGENTEIHIGAVIGHFPQDLSFKKKKSRLVIGKNNIIREYVTIHRGTAEDSRTTIGDNNFIMGFAHIAHNCNIGSNVVMANASILGGYVEVEDRAFISAYAAAHQYVRIGAISMISAMSRITKDIPPYMLAKGEAAVYGINVIGLRRANFSQDVRNRIKRAHKILYRSGYKLSQAITEIEKAQLGGEVQHLIEFLKKESKKGIARERLP